MILTARNFRPGRTSDVPDGIETVEIGAGRAAAARGPTDPVGMASRDASSPADSGDDCVIARIAVGVGNTLYYLGHPKIAGGRNLLHFPWTLAEYRANQELGGNPFLYPWANRLEREGFEFQGRRYDFPEGAGGPAYWSDGNGLPLHGCLLKSDRWRTIECGPVTDASGEVRHRAEQIFDSRHPAFESFPFEHRLEMEHRLGLEQGSDSRSGIGSARDGGAQAVAGAGVGLRLQITTRIENCGSASMPLSFGYHPYFSFAGTPRDQVRLDLPARCCFETDARLLPTGRLLNVKTLWPDHRDLRLAEHVFDHGFTGLQRTVSESDGARRSGDSAAFRMTTLDCEIGVAFGTGYDVAVIYAPRPADAGSTASPDFVCIEPMLSATNALCFPGGDSAWPRARELEPAGSFAASFTVSAANSR